MDRRRIAAIATAAAGVLLAAWLLWPKKPDDDKALIRAAITRMAEKAAERDVNGILENVSERYQGEGGDKRELKRYLLGYLLRSEVVTALPANVQFAAPVENGKAKVSFVVLLARKPATKVEDLRTEELVGSHRIEAEMEKEDGVWRAVDANRRDASPQDWLR
ncbi:MAG TPA: hypothetical protein VGK67_25025 [Myxococcales bacterium]|jgi:hypothetical protein